MRLVQRFIGSAAFATLGLMVGFRGVAWPSIRYTFHLPLDAVGLWLLAATANSIVSSYNGGYIGSLVGTGPFLAVSTAGVALGLLINSRTPHNKSLTLGVGYVIIDPLCGKFPAVKRG